MRAAVGTWKFADFCWSVDVTCMQPRTTERQPSELQLNNDKLEVVRLILGAGVEVDACGDEKKTALHYAARCGRMDVTPFFMPAPNRSKIGS